MSTSREEMPRRAASYMSLDDEEKRRSRRTARKALHETEQELSHKIISRRPSQDLKANQQTAANDGSDELPQSSLESHISGTTDSTTGTSISSLTASNPPLGIGAQRVSRNNGRLTVESLHLPSGVLLSRSDEMGRASEDSPPEEGEPTERGRSLPDAGFPSSRRRSSGSIQPIFNAVLVADEDPQASENSHALVQATAVPEVDKVGSAPGRVNRRMLAILGFCIVCGIVVAVILTATRKSNPVVVVIDPADEAAAIMAGGFANTTRFWDCSGGACGCAHLITGDKDEPTFCRGNSMFRAPFNNPYSAAYYGTAAVSAALGGDWWLGEACGKCWRLTGTSNVGVDAFPATTTIVVKGANFCAPEKCGDHTMFSIAAPGFDSDPANRYEVCEERELGDNYAGFSSACVGWMTGNSTDPFENCDCSLFTDRVLEEGCKNFLSLGWDDPVVEYELLEECPEELGRLPCWTENGDTYPEGIPQLCANPNAE